MSNQTWTNNSDQQCKNTEKDESQGYHHRAGAIYIPVSSANKTDRHDIAEILFNVALNTTMPSNEKKPHTHARTHAHVETGVKHYNHKPYPIYATLNVNFRVLTKHCNKYINL